jgi:hypothetical protein
MCYPTERAMSPEAPSASEQPTHGEDGVDVTLIRWMLSLTPAERLEVLRQFVNRVLEARAANSPA